MKQADQRLLQFVAVHRLVVASQAALLLEVDDAAAAQELDALVNEGLVRSSTIAATVPAAYAVTEAGTAAVGSSLPVPTADVGSYRHDVGVVWLWLAARDQAFGEMKAVLSARQMIDADRSGEARQLLEAGRRFGARVPGVAGLGPEGLQYPDVGLTLPDWGWIAVHLQLSVPDRGQLRPVLARYGTDAQVRVILFMVDDPDRVGRVIQEVAAELGLSDETHVQRVNPQIGGGG